MSAPNNNVVYVGTEASPIALGAAGGASDVWTWNHNQGRKAAKLEVLDAASRQPVGPAEDAASTLKAVNAAQPTTSQITLTNQSSGALNCILRVTWEDFSPESGKAEAASVGTLS